MKNKNINTNILDNIIIGRVEPQIYAFSTKTVPNYLKVGDTYRPLETRLNEWRKYFPNLKKEYSESAKIDNEIYFRDHSVHDFLTKICKLKLLQRNTFKNIPHYSKEFFENATCKDIENAIIDIKKNYKGNHPIYQYYKFEDSHIPLDHTYKRVDNFNPRPNQEATINKFKKAYKSGKKNLLMYAVMRFGKSFTSLCCATEMQARLIVVVSAKADVREEWKKTTQSHIRFDGYEFIDSKNLLENNSKISEQLKINKLVIFLTLQDLQGTIIKDKHKELFTTNIDLLIIDETHFGARAEQFGAALKSSETEEYNAQQKELHTLNKEQEKFEKETKELKSKVRLHLSGTPYRILMGSEFAPEEIIAFYQFADIVKDQKKWEEDNLELDEPKEEWENPYYGFPEMVRFAFNPNESSRKKIEDLESNGISSAFSVLFKPKSISKDENNLYKTFINEQEVLDLLEIIDGSKNDDNLLGFLDYDKIKDGKMCRHIVCVLPYRASCDAFEELIRNKKFKNLSNYTIINIAGLESTLTTKKVKHEIETCEKKNKKTITLTVNKMLTGCTIEQWDTMLYLKDTSSPQEYDQAIFRLQNQYIKSYTSKDGNVIKYNMKPQTLLVDFCPNRMFYMQEQKSLIYNVNTENHGNKYLENRIERELEISPIVVINSRIMERINASNLLQKIINYSSNRSALDEALEIPVDFELLKIEDFRKEIEKQSMISSKNGFKDKPSDGEGQELTVPDMPVDKNNEGKEDNNIPTPSNKTKEEETKSIEEIWQKKFARYYSRILFFVLLSKNSIKTIHNIVRAIDSGDTNDVRIAKNLGLKQNILLYFNNMHPLALNKLENTITRINMLSQDDRLEPKERVQNAMKHFARISESEVVTPQKIAEEMVALLSKEDFNRNSKILDINSKQGEFAIALYDKFGDKLKNNIYSIPSSGIAYEFTRKIYEALDMPIENIYSDFISYDIIIDDNEKIIKKLKNMDFNAVIGNPPYQITSNNTSDKPVYHQFMDIAFKLSTKSILITPARFLFNAGKTPKDWNDKMLNDPHFKVIWCKPTNKVFDNVDIKGGIAVTYKNSELHFGAIKTYTAFPELNSISQKVTGAANFCSIMNMIYAPESYKLSNKLHSDFNEIEGLLSNGHKYDVTTNIFDRIKHIFHDTKPNNTSEYIQLLGVRGRDRLYKWIKKEYIKEHPNLDRYKVFVPKSNGSGAIGEVLSTPLIGEPLIGHTQTFISIGNFEKKFEAEALLKYIKSKFARTLLGILKVTQDNKKSVWKFVPTQNFTEISDIDWNRSIENIDRQLYAKYELNEEEINFIETTIKPMSN